MPAGPSGRIVVDIDPALKQEIYAALERDGLNLKQWFLQQAETLLQDRRQLSLGLKVADGDDVNRRYR